MNRLVRPLTWDQNADKAAGWDVQPLLETNDHAWEKMGPLKGEITLDAKAGDKQGPLTLGLTLSRPAPAPAAAKDKPADAGDQAAARTQRIAVVGNSEFLADNDLAAYGNENFGVNLVQWLASRDSQLNVEVPKAPDTELVMSGLESWLVLLVFAIVLPLLLLGYGIGRWLKRRRR